MRLQELERDVAQIGARSLPEIVLLRLQVTAHAEWTELREPAQAEEDEVAAREAALPVVVEVRAAYRARKEHACREVPIDELVRVRRTYRR